MFHSCTIITIQGISKKYPFFNNYFEINERLLKKKQNNYFDKNYSLRHTLHGYILLPKQLNFITNSIFPLTISRNYNLCPSSLCF